MKRILTGVLAALMLALSGCGCGDVNADLVFVNGSDAIIGSVTVDWLNRSETVQPADSSPLKPGESFGFETGSYPVTVRVYRGQSGGWNPPELAVLTVWDAPGEGERWYVTAQNNGNGLTLSLSTCWPEGV